MARFQVHYGDLHQSKKRYVVWDDVAKRTVFESDAKSTVIGEAERRNGFRVTGDESTYGKQVAEGG